MVYAYMYTAGTIFTTQSKVLVHYTEVLLLYMGIYVRMHIIRRLRGLPVRPASAIIRHEQYRRQNIITLSPF